MEDISPRLRHVQELIAEYLAGTTPRPLPDRDFPFGTLSASGISLGTEGEASTPVGGNKVQYHMAGYAYGASEPWTCGNCRYFQQGSCDVVMGPYAGGYVGSQDSCAYWKPHADLQGAGEPAEGTEMPSHMGMRRGGRVPASSEQPDGDEIETAPMREHHDFRDQAGDVPGHGPDEDTVPALLTPREYVLTDEMVAALGGTPRLERLRKRLNRRED